MSKPVFVGAAVAIVTPFYEDGGINFEELKKLIEFEIAEGIDSIVICGSTGEAATMTEQEHIDAIKFAVDTVAGRVPVIAGTGSNDTAFGVELTKKAYELGADAALLVTPYYNKATQKGLVQMFSEIADKSTAPVILYNVPSRTGCNLLPSSCAILADHPNIVGVKEASGNISQIAEIAALTRDKDFVIYSGNDDQIIPIFSLGGMGVISVLSNILPRKTVQMCDKYFSGDVKGACDMQLDMLPLINSLFSEVNPIPARSAVAALGFGENYLRLPLTPMEPEHEAVMFECMRQQGLDV